MTRRTKKRTKKRMQSSSTSLTPRPIAVWYPIPKPNHHHYLHLKRRLSILPPSTHKTHFLTLSATHSCHKQHDLNNKDKNQSYSYSNSNSNQAFCEEELYTFNSTNQIRITHIEKTEEEEEEEEEKIDNSEVIFSNMLWADLKAALGQRLNFEAIVCSAGVVSKERHLLVPHVTVPDIRYIDWAELHRRGFKGVVFDKDNTITAPYTLTLWGPLASSLEQCKSVFGDDIAVFSNSAGLYEYDPDGSKAITLEKSIGIKVLRHRVKKPAGTAEEIEEQFGCGSLQLIMVGDRPFTDIVYGNRNGFLTILTEPLTLAAEPFIVQQVRKLETFLVNRWCKRGLKPSHNLLPDVMQCVKDPPSL